MDTGSLNFGIWWYMTLMIVGVGTWLAVRARAQISWDAAAFVFLVGVGAGLVSYLAPSGLQSVQSQQDLQMRFFAALCIALLAVIRTAPRVGGAACGPSLALAGFAGVSAPLLAFVASSLIVCGPGQPSCGL